MEEFKIDTDNFEALLKEKRHKELFNVLKSILNKLELYSKDDTVKSLLVELLTKHKELPTSITILSSVLVKKFDELKNVKRDWVFKIERDNNGLINNIIAKQK